MIVLCLVVVALCLVVVALCLVVVADGEGLIVVCCCYCAWSLVSVVWLLQGAGGCNGYASESRGDPDAPPQCTITNVVPQ